jgi:hypothetical protein
LCHFQTASWNDLLLNLNLLLGLVSGDMELDRQLFGLPESKSLFQGFRRVAATRTFKARGLDPGLSLRRDRDLDYFGHSHLLKLSFQFVGPAIGNVTAIWLLGHPRE